MGISFAEGLRIIGAAGLGFKDPRAGAAVAESIAANTALEQSDEELEGLVDSLPAELVEGFGGREAALSAFRTGTFQQLSPHVLQQGRDARERAGNQARLAGQQSDTSFVAKTPAEQLLFNEGTQEALREARAETSHVADTLAKGYATLHQAKEIGPEAVRDAAARLGQLVEKDDRIRPENEGGLRIPWAKYSEILIQDQVVDDRVAAIIAEDSPNAMSDVAPDSLITAQSASRVKAAKDDVTGKHQTQFSALSGLVGSVTGAEDVSDLIDLLPPTDQAPARRIFSKAKDDPSLAFLYSAEHTDDRTWLRDLDARSLRESIQVSQARRETAAEQQTMLSAVRSVPGTSELISEFEEESGKIETPAQFSEFAGVFRGHLAELDAGPGTAIESLEEANRIVAFGESLKTRTGDLIAAEGARLREDFVRTLPEEEKFQASADIVAATLPDAAALIDFGVPLSAPTEADVTDEMLANVMGGAHIFAQASPERIERMRRDMAPAARVDYGEHISDVARRMPGTRSLEEALENEYSEPIEFLQEVEKIHAANVSLYRDKSEQNAETTLMTQARDERQRLEALQASVPTRIPVAKLLSTISRIPGLEDWEDIKLLLNTLQKDQLVDEATLSREESLPSEWEAADPERQFEIIVSDFVEPRGSLVQGQVSQTSRFSGTEQKLMAALVHGYLDRVIDVTRVAPRSHEQFKERFKHLPEWADEIAHITDPDDYAVNWSFRYYGSLIGVGGRIGRE